MLLYKKLLLMTFGTTLVYFYVSIFIIGGMLLLFGVQVGTQSLEDWHECTPLPRDGKCPQVRNV